MKSIIKKRSFFFILPALLFFSACTKDFSDRNTPANLLTEDKTNPDLLLTAVQYTSIIQRQNSTGEGGNTSNYAGMSVAPDNGPFADDFNDYLWNLTYTSYANNLASIIRITKDNPELVNKKAIARIMKAMVFSQLTDTYGDVPYFQANLSPQEAIPDPQYDTQKSIYEDLLKELKEAVAELDESKASFGSADLMYGGDIAKWKKFGASLRLRLAMRVRYADPQLAAANMSDLNESNLITTRADDAIAYTSSDVAAHQNALYNAKAGGGYFTKGLIGKTLLDILIGTGDAHNPQDPRIKIYADTAQAKWPPTLTPPLPYFGYRGQPLLGAVPIEEKYPYQFGSVSEISFFWYSPVIEIPVLRSSEVYFLLAEAALYEMISGDASDFYKKGIAAAIVQSQDFYEKSKPQMAGSSGVLKLFNPDWTDDDIQNYLAYKEMSQPEIDDFLASSATTLTGGDEEKLEQIINQKTVALYPNALEGWTEWRRTGYPRVLIAADEQSALHGVPRRRERYPTNESLINSVHYNEAVDRMGGNGLLLKVWWDANPNPNHPHPGAVESRPNPWQ